MSDKLTFKRFITYVNCFVHKQFISKLEQGVTFNISKITFTHNKKSFLGYEVFMDILFFCFQDSKIQRIVKLGTGTARAKLNDG